MSRSAKSSMALLLALVMGGCAGSATPTPSTSPGVLEAFPPIRNSKLAPCDMQREVAAHNSRVATFKSGREVVYRAPCDIDRAPPPKKGTGTVEAPGNPRHVAEGT